MKKTRRYANVGLPKFWRPKLSDEVKLDAKLVHHDLVAKMVAGPSATDLWEWMETGYTYSQMMRLYAEDGTEFTEEAVDAIALQLQSYESILDRLRTIGKVRLSQEEMEIAKTAAGVFDGLIDMDRNGIADSAARWSIEVMAKIREAA